VTDNSFFEKLGQSALTGEQTQQLVKKIGAVFQDAIDARSPKKRPPGKGGLRAEKGYYRMLYLETAFNETSAPPEPKGPDAPDDPWARLAEIVRQLADLPELRAELLAGAESALDQITSQPPIDA
jgi:hypothetical protein